MHFSKPFRKLFFSFFIFFSVCVQWCRNSNPKKSLTFREPSVCRRDLANVSSLNPSLCRVPQSPVAKFYDSLREYKEKKKFYFFHFFSNELLSHSDRNSQILSKNSISKNLSCSQNLSLSQNLPF